MFDTIASKFSSLFERLQGKSTFDSNTLNKELSSIQDLLVDSDVPLATASSFVALVEKDLVGTTKNKKLSTAEAISKIVYDRMVDFLGGGNVDDFSVVIPSVIMLVGLQGSGKTTTAVKLAHFINEQTLKRGKKRNILLASVDFSRPAAREQLSVLAKQNNIDCYVSGQTDPIKAAKDIYDYYKKNGYELLIIDTAGRLHVDESLLNELVTIDKLVSPRYKFLVLDSMIGQQSMQVARAFSSVAYTGSILTKADSDARCGVALAFRYEMKKPIFFLGTGERCADFEFFRPKRIASRIIGMGDVATLVERAEQKISQQEQIEAQKFFESNKFSFGDFLGQLDMMSKLGSLSSLARMMPGFASLKISQDQLDQGEVESRKFKALILSMTPKERAFHSLIEQSRKIRIAKGAGVNLAEVDSFLRKFEQSQQFAKIFKKMGKNGNPFGSR